MTIRPLRACLAAACLLPALSACGHPPPSAAPAPAITALPQPAPANPTEQAETIPGDADAIWRAIDGHRGELKAAVAAGELSSVHHHAFAIRDLVAALPAQSRQLPREGQDKLGNEVAFVSTLASRLDEAGDGGDRAAAQAAQAQLEEVLAGMQRPR